MSIWKKLFGGSASSDSSVETTPNDAVQMLRTLPQFDWSNIDLNDKKIWETTNEMGTIIDKEFVAEGVSAEEATSIMCAKTGNASFRLMRLNDKLFAVTNQYNGRDVVLASVPDGTKGSTSGIGSYTTYERYVIALRHSKKEYSILQYRYEHYRCIG